MAAQGSSWTGGLKMRTEIKTTDGKRVLEVVSNHAS